MTVAPLLEMRGISKRFPGVIALDEVSLQIGRGEVVAICGENGAGKSTLMKILGGVHQPDSGEILIDGQPVKIHGVTDSMKHGIAFIHQELNVLGNLDVAENVFLGREPKNVLGLMDSKKIHADTAPFIQRLSPNISTRTTRRRRGFARCATPRRPCIRANPFRSMRRAARFSASPGLSGPGGRKSPRPFPAWMIRRRRKFSSMARSFPSASRATRLTTAFILRRKTAARKGLL